MASVLRRGRARRLLLLSRRWQRRAIFICGGIVVGAAAVVLAVVADLAQEAFARALSGRPSAALLITPAGFALAVFLTVRFFPNAQGSGIPQAIAAREVRDELARSKLVSLRIGFGKVLLTLLGLLCGASAGREGPTVQVGASIMAYIGRMSPGRQPGLILAGAAAGVAAAFNTPLAGIVFGIEEMSRSFEVRASGLIIGAVITAGLTATALLGNYTYFGHTAAAFQSPFDWLAVPVCGVVGGIAGGLFSRLLVTAARGLPGAVGRWIKAHRVAFAAACGLGVALCGLASNGAVYGTGYAQARSLLEGSADLAWTFAPVKLVATLLTAISGIPGGIFAPSLAVGAGIGAEVAQFFPTTALGAIVLIGMVSYFAGVVQAPITAFVIVMEMTDNHAMLIPLMTAAVIAYGSSRLVCPEGVYHALAAGFREERRLAGGA